MACVVPRSRGHTIVVPDVPRSIDESLLSA